MFIEIKTLADISKYINVFQIISISSREHMGTIGGSIIYYGPDGYKMETYEEPKDLVKRLNGETEKMGKIKNRWEILDL